MKNNLTFLITVKDDIKGTNKKYTSHYSESFINSRVESLMDEESTLSKEQAYSQVVQDITTDVNTDYADVFTLEHDVKMTVCN